MKTLCICIIFAIGLSGCVMSNLDPRGTQDLRVSIDLNSGTATTQFLGPKPYWVEETLDVNTTKTLEATNIDILLHTESQSSTGMFSNLFSMISGYLLGKGTVPTP